MAKGRRSIGALLDDEFVEQMPLIPYGEQSVDDGSVKQEAKDKSLKGKTAESLAHSRMRRDAILRAFHGEVPQSIMAARKHGRDSDLGRGSYSMGLNATEEQLKVSKSFEISGVGGHSDKTFLSQFPQNVGRGVTLLYSDPGATIFDPFAGHNSRMELVVKAGRHYVGNDISHEFMEWNRHEAKKLKRKYPQYSITLTEGDSRYLPLVKSNSADFTLTSPPYWNIEDYGDEPEQLGKLAGGYQGFLDGMQSVIKENYRILRPGSFCVYFINDFRRDGKFYPYHYDTMTMLMRAGFTLWDMMITDLGPNIRSAFITQVVDQKILPKRHEYGVVARKPFPRKERTGAHPSQQPSSKEKGAPKSVKGRPAKKDKRSTQAGGKGSKV